MTLVARLAVLSLIIPLAVTLPGCRTSTCPGDYQGPVCPIDPDPSLRPIEGQILFRVAERHECPGEDCEPSIFLLMHTETIYGCCNFEIATEVEITGDIVSVALQGIYEPLVCLTALGPASAYLALDLTPSDYAFRFCHRGRLEQYRLTITDEAIITSGADADVTEPLALLTWRYPRESFCYLCGTTTETSWICDAFADSLMLSGRLSEFTFPDSGNIPYPRTSSYNQYDMPARYFRYATEADYDSAGAVLGRFAEGVLSQHPGVIISLRNWRNKFFRSWQMDD